MFRFLRQGHKVVGLAAAVFLILLSTTGFLLALKANVAWMRPPVAKAEKLASPAEIASMDSVLASVFALNNPHLQTVNDVDRVDYRPKSNIFKVLSKQGYQEVQVDGKTAKVLSVSFRNDQLAEDFHDLSFFSDALKDYGLPLVAVGC